MSTFVVPDPIEVAYKRLISETVKLWIPTKLTDMSEEYWLKELRSISTRKSIISSSVKVASNMVTRINAINLKDWRKAALKSGRSELIHDLLQQELSGRLGVRVKDFLTDSSRSIADIPKDVADQLSLEIMRAQHAGARPNAIAQLLKLRFPLIVNSKISLIARTQVSSANTALTRARSEELDIPCFVWETSQDGRRVRPSHRAMQGVVVFWKDLPSPEALIGQKDSLGHYAAGDCPNCRCNSLPLLSLEDVFSQKTKFVKVYHDGAIQRLTRDQLTKLSGIESRIAA